MAGVKYFRRQLAGQYGRDGYRRVAAVLRILTSRYGWIDRGGLVSPARHKEPRRYSGVMTGSIPTGTGEIFFPPISRDPRCYSPVPCYGVPSIDRLAPSPGGRNLNGKQHMSAYPILSALDIQSFTASCLACQPAIRLPGSIIVPGSGTGCPFKSISLYFLQQYSFQWIG